MGRRRDEWDGLRGLALFTVLLYHADHHLLPNGFISIDVFFVLSGFLIISTHLNRLSPQEPPLGSHSGQGDALTLSVLGSSTLSFYIRRFRRLQPASYVALVVVALAFSRVASAATLEQTEWDFYSAALFFSNWHFIGKQFDYWAESSSPILHFWSLSVEEQFYMVLPVIVAIVAMVAGSVQGTQDHANGLRFLRVNRLALVVIAASSLAYGAYATYWVSMEATSVYMSTLCRVYHMALGSVLGVDVLMIKRGASDTLSKLVMRALEGYGLRTTIAELMLIGGFMSLLVLQGQPQWTLGVASATLTGGVLLVMEMAHIQEEERKDGESRQTLLQRALSMRALALLGRASYSIYLYHYPIIWIGDRLAILPAKSEAMLRTATCLVMSVALGVAGYELIEMPTMQISLQSVWRKVMTAISMVVVPLSLVMVLAYVFSSSPALVEQLRTACNIKPLTNGQQNRLGMAQTSHWNDTWLTDDQKTPVRIMAIGDSWSARDSNAIRWYIERSKKLHLDNIFKGACPLVGEAVLREIFENRPDRLEDCLEHTKKYEAALVEEHIDILIVSTFSVLVPVRDPSVLPNYFARAAQYMRDLQSLVGHLVVFLPVPLCFGRNQPELSVDDCIAALPEMADHSQCNCRVDEQAIASKKLWATALEEAGIDTYDYDDMVLMGGGTTLGEKDGVIPVYGQFHLSAEILQKLVGSKMQYVLEQSGYKLAMR